MRGAVLYAKIYKKKNHTFQQQKEDNLIKTWAEKLNRHLSKDDEWSTGT